MKTSLVMVAVVALVTTLLGAHSGRAADDPDTEAAKKLFKVASANYDLGRYEEALGEFQDAYSKKPLPAFFFNIALCHRKLGHHQKAVEYFERFLAEDPKAKNRDDAEAMLAEEKVAAANEPAPLTQEPPTPPPAAAAPAPTPPPPPPEDSTWVWVASGVGAAAVVAGAVALVVILAQPPQPVAVVDLRGAS